MNFVKFKILLFIAFLCALPLKAISLTCDDVVYVDNLYNYNSALTSRLGCETLTAEVIVSSRASSIPIISEDYSRSFYASPQPRLTDFDDYKKVVNDAVLSKEFYSLLSATWFDFYLSPKLFKQVDLDYYEIEDPIAKKLALGILASRTILEPQRLKFHWFIEEFEAIQVLMELEKIPYIADHLAYAYLEGVGVAANISKVNELSDYASQNFSEAQRWNGLNLLETDVQAGLKLLKKSAESGCITCIVSYIDSLTERIDYISGVKDTILNYMPILESLGFAGHKDIQRILGDLYVNGEVLEVNKERAVAWYEKSADQGVFSSADYLIEHYAAMADYKKAAEYISVSADLGYVFNHGYFELIHAIKLSEGLWSNSEKLLQYVKFHCLNNQYVTDSDKKVCENYPIKNAEFEEIVPLVDVTKNLDLVQYSNRLNLSTGKYRALVIGNEDYASWTNLETPISDIEKVSQVLSKDYKFEVTKLENATRREMLEAIYNIGKNAEFNDHVLIYYAGHGIVDNATNEGYWIPSNADENFRPDWVSNSEVKTALKSINARHLLVMADSCYSGTIIRSAGAVNDNITNSLLERLFAKKAKVAITSGGNEPVADSTGGSEISIFAKAFTDSLQENTNEFLAASSMFSSIRDKVSKEANQTPQYANIRELDDDGGEFVFRKVR